MSLFLEQARQAIRNNRPGAALEQLQQMFVEMHNLPELPFFSAGHPQADQLLTTIARMLLSGCKPGPASSPPTGPAGIIATRLSVYGGCTPLVGDLVNALPDTPQLWLTEDAPEKNALARTGLPSAQVVKKKGFMETAAELIRQLAAAEPQTLFLLHEPQDVMAVVAAVALMERGTRVVLIHHCDQFPSVGIFVEGIRVVDLTPRAAAFSRHILGLDNTWLPLTCPDPGPSRKQFRGSGTLRTAMTGHTGKFSSMSNPGYPELVATILAKTGGQHVHIGPIKSPLLRQIRKMLRARNLQTSSFIQIESVPNLAAALEEQQIDLVFNTYPFGGARAAVETMASGTPMAWHSPREEFDLTRTQMKYPGAPIWRTLADIDKLLSEVNTAWFAGQAESAREHYLEFHHPRHWREAFTRADVAGFQVPPAYSRQSVVQSILDNALARRDFTNIRWRRRERLIMSARRRKAILNQSL